MMLFSLHSSVSSVNMLMLFSLKLSFQRKELLFWVANLRIVVGENFCMAWNLSIEKNGVKAIGSGSFLLFVR